MTEAWVTSAVEENVVDKALTLAGSLRRVHTAKKLVVFTTTSVCDESRGKLKEIFDLVLLLEQTIPNGLTLEDYAKLSGFSLNVFNKCVYLSPNALVLKNCDGIFGKYTTFAAVCTSIKKEVDTSVYLYVPCLALSRMSSKREGGLPKSFNLWLQNNISNIECLDGQDYNLKLNLRGNTYGLNWNASIINFENAHPLDFPKEIMAKTSETIGFFAKFCVDECWKIYMEDVKPSRLDLTENALISPYKKEPIAIVGLSFRLPGGNDVDEFWSLLAEGRSAVTPLPSHRWSREHSYYHCKNRKVEAGFLNVPIEQFDAKFFGLSPKDAEFLDPQQRILLEMCWEALEDAMIDPLKLKGTQTGVFVGSWIYDYKDMLSRSVDVDFFRTYMGNSIATSAARISHFLETTGPSIATESGCSSAIAAVDMACKSLRNGDSSLAIAAGVNLLLRPFEAGLMDYILSPDYRCKAFDAGANGFARAEGCAVLLLKRLSDAVKEGDSIWGLIRGTALTQEGLSKSLGTPTVQCETLALELALKDGNVDPKEVSYIEAHGTGTAVGDPMEIMAITKAYSEGRTEPLLIGSVKTNVGHTESVSGITGIIKVLLSMKNELIPKHLNLNTLNPNISLDLIPAQIPMSPVAWPKKAGKPRIAGVSSFGISGTDGHAIIEEPPQILCPEIKFMHERPIHIMKLSAKSIESMDELVQKYLKICNDKIERNEDTSRDFANFAYSANVGRSTFNHRAVIIAKNFAEAARILQKKEFKHSEVQNSESKLCFLFTGQGSQYPSMAKRLYETSPIFKNHFEKCDEILQRRFSISIKNIMWAGTGNQEELSRTLYSQTSIYVVEYCLLKLWESWGIKPDYVMGHSLGEFAAAVGAGALDFEDAVMLVAERSRLIDQLPRGKMLVIRADKKTVDTTILAFQNLQPNFWVDCAALNSPEQTVVAGDSEMIDEFCKFCGEKSLKTIALAATHAFHSRHMDPMLEEYREVVEMIKKPALGNDPPKYISGVEGKLIDVNSIDAEYWLRHTRKKVKYIDACRVAQQEGCNLFLEIGPHPVLSALTMMNIESAAVTCLSSIRRNEEEWVTMLDSLSKLYSSNWRGEIDWNGFDRFYSRKKVKLPFYPFNRKPIWARTGFEYPQVHPLIGKIIPTATDQTIFRNSLTLKNANYVQDHVIGDTVIFPGAGFLEMCLTGGHLTVQGLIQELVKPRRPIQLKYLKIATPFAIDDSGVFKLQTVIALDDERKEDETELGYNVGVHRLINEDDGAGTWIQHATAKFLPVMSSLPVQTLEPVNITQIQSSWEKTNNKEFYEKLPEVGLRFGPQFQSLKNGWKSETGILASVRVPQDYGNYLIHPIIADAMIQAVMLWTSKDKLKKKLQVPVQIGEFIWLKQAESSIQFVYCFSEKETKVATCILVDDTGCPLAVMKGVDFMDTTAKLVEGMVTQQSVAMPKLWKDLWKNCRGPMQGYLSHEAPLEELDFDEEDLRYFDERNNIPENELNFYKNLIKLTRLSILRALYLLGWRPKVNVTFTVDSIIETLSIQENFRQYMHFFFRSMTKEDIKMLKVIDVEENAFQFMTPPPTREELEEGLEYVTSSSDYDREEYRLIMELDKWLSKILKGDMLPLSILFPEDSTKPSARKFYKSESEQQSSRPAAVKIFKLGDNAVRQYSRNSETPSQLSTFRILEVGAGTGVSTRAYLEEIVPYAKSTQIEYFFTDVSAAFFTSSVEKELKEFGVSFVFKKFDMDEDPLEQGLCPGYFDLILGTEVFHIARDIKKTMKGVRCLLKPGGLIATNETICPDERITYIFGLLDGYWQFEDRDFRKHHTTLSPDMWREALSEAGFHAISVTPMYNNVHGVITAHAAPVENNFLLNVRPSNKSWIIFSERNGFSEGLQEKLLNVNRKCKVVSMPTQFTEAFIEDFMKIALELTSDDACKIEGVIYLWSLSPKTRDQAQVSLPFVTLMKLISEMKSPPRAYAVMRGACAIESSDVVDPTSGTLVGFCKALVNENPSLTVPYFDLDPNKDPMDQLEEVFMNLWVEHKQGAAFRDGLRLRPKLTVGKIIGHEPLTLPNGCDRFQLVLPKTRLISDLEFTHLEPYTIGENDVQVQVKAAALNFRDVFTVIKPIPAFEKINSIGLEVAGVVTKTGENVTKFQIGDRVFGMVLNDNLCLPSSCKTEEGALTLLPPWMTFSEGTTLPVAFFTAFYCLITIAEMKRGETVLIHTASGGVGLVAVQLCRYVGANVIATAGSTRKRNYLRNLGIQHVFHSRTTDFKNEILEVTEGRGVDVVLNSLTGPGFKEASLDALGKNGRFIEMSKLNVWDKEEVKALRTDVFYEIVDLTSLEYEKYECLSEELRKFTEAGLIKPIPYEIFDALNIRGALNYLQKAKHIGKIVCMMPETKLENSKLIVSTPLFNPESTYLVTGGLGGIGFEVVKWMLGRGAKHIAIVGRSPPKPEIASQLHTWNQNGYHVQAFSVDVGNYDQLKALLLDLKKPQFDFPQLRGVMHAAGVLNDGVLENQSWEKFSQLFNPKVNGSWNLHDLTKDYLLEHFVLFSSMAATFGSMGQTNHSASNAFEDSLAAYRRSNGLPATCVNWGNWGEVGVATEVDFPGVRPIPTSQGLLALETFMKTQTNQMAVLNVDSFSLLVKLLPQVKHYVDDIRLLGGIKTSFVLMNSDEFWNEVDSVQDGNGKVECFKKLIKAVMRNILKMERDEPIDDQTEFQTLGIDSLMMLEMKNGMQNILGGRITLTASQLKDCNNTLMLANTLVNILKGNGFSQDQLSQDELKQLIREDSKLLPENITIEDLEMKPIEQVESVLLTGVTGNLGPYLLRELTQRSQVKTVYCLIRPTSKLSGMDRLNSKLEELQLNDTVIMAKVKVFEGDITSEKLGLTENDYFKLCEDVDAIVHSAVRSDYTAKYWKAPEANKTHMRTVNVIGTVRLLVFAAERTLKHFFYASTMLTFTGTGEDGQFSEGWQAVSCFDSAEINVLGYVISKHIGEQLVRQALQRGIPCKAFRFPLISGDSETGKVNHQQNHAMLRWLTCMKLGVIHDIPAPITVIPADHCAKISLNIFFNPEAPMDVYNIVKRSTEVEQILVEVALAFGIELEIVSFEEFMERLKSEGENSPIAPFIQLYMEEGSRFRSTFENPSTLALQKYFEDGSCFLNTSKLMKYDPMYDGMLESVSDVLIRDFKYLKNEGVFEKYGIRASS